MVGLILPVANHHIWTVRVAGVAAETQRCSGAAGCQGVGAGASCGGLEDSGNAQWRCHILGLCLQWMV